MKKISVSLAGAFVLAALFIIFSVAPGAHAQIAPAASNACPAGYTCKPVPQVPGCPTNFICVRNTTMPSVTLMMPTGGQTFVAGATIRNVYWIAHNLPQTSSIDDMKFTLIGNGTSVPLTVNKTTTFAAGFNGQFSRDGASFVNGLSIPANIRGGEYMLSITCPTCGQGTGDQTIGTITVLASTSMPSLSLEVPAKTSLVPGKAMTFAWKSKNILSRTPLSIILYKDGDPSVAYTVSTAAWNLGSYTWTVPATAIPGTYHAQISCDSCAKDMGVITYDWSTGYTIPTPGSKVADVVNEPMITIAPASAPAPITIPTASTALTPTPTVTPAPTVSPSPAPSPAALIPGPIPAPVTTTSSSSAAPITPQAPVPSPKPVPSPSASPAAPTATE